MLKTIEPFPSHYTDKARLYGVQAEDVDVVWSEVKPFLEKTLERSDGKYSIDDLYHYIKEREMQLWVVFDRYLICFVITQILTFPRKKILAIPYVGGKKMSKWIHLYERIAAFGKAHGCEISEGYAREGWLRVLAKYGYKKVYSTIQAPL